MIKKTIFSAQAVQSCPKCHEGSLQIRRNSAGLFKQCSYFPDCDYRQLISSTGHVLTEVQGKTCPKCDGILVIRQQKYGLTISCSYYPSCDYQEKVQSRVETEVKCPCCGSGKLLQKLSRFGKKFYACDGYPNCRFTLNHAPLSGTCPHCGYALLLQKKSAQGMATYCANQACAKKLTEHR